uniref:Uncharacterized protein n=1 Tax=Arundo donax TaxID=35708 RepID=A0A0A9AT50_ARUDO
MKSTFKSYVNADRPLIPASTFIKWLSLKNMAAEQFE